MIVVLLDKRTNQKYEIEESGTVEENEFMWKEGNYACDCNRGIFCGIEDVDCGEDRFELISMENF